MKIAKPIHTCVLHGFVALALAAGPVRAEGNDYPTSTRADYVIGCMAANGNTQQSLERCSCSIDAIANVLPYEKYVQAETVLRISQAPGQRSEVMRSTGVLRDIVAGHMSGQEV